MLDLGKWLKDRKKQAEGVIAQANMWDGGKTYSTVVNNQRPGSNPFVDNRIKNAKYGVLANNKQAQDNFLNSIKQNNRPEMATFESLKNAPGRIRSSISDAIGYGDIKTDGKGNINPNKPTGLAENIVAPLSNIGQFNPVRSAGDVGQYIDAVSDKSRFNDLGNRVGSATRGMSNFGKVDDDSTWASKNLSNPVSRNLGEGLSMLGQTANYASPVVGPVAIAGTIASEANDVLQQARDKGENELIANLKGLSSGALQAAVERYSSKFTSGLPGSSAVGKLTSNKLAKIPASLAGGGLTEGAEEFVQGLIGNVARGNEWSEGLKEQTLAGAKGGVMLGGFFGGANSAANRSQGIKQEAVQQVEQQNPQLQQTGIPAEPGSIRERIQQAKENVKSTIAKNITPLQGNEAGFIQNPLNINNPDGANTGGFQINNPDNARMGLEINNPDGARTKPLQIRNPEGAKTGKPLKVKANVPLVGEGLSGAAQQSYESARNKTNKVYRSGNIDSSRGAFFSSDRDLAGTYSTNPVKGDSGRSVNEYQINENTKLKKVSGGQLNFAKSIGIDVDSIKKNIQKDYDSGKKFENDNNVQQETLMRVEDLIKGKLSKQGFDGVEYTGDYYGKKHQEYHLFNPTKSIKQDPSKAFNNDPDSVRRLELDYLKNNKGPSNSLQGEGDQAPINLDKDKKQSLLEKTRAAAKLLKEDQGGGYDGGRSAQDRVNKSKSPLTDKAYSETFGVPLDKAKKDLAKTQEKAEPLSSAGMTEEQATKKLESNAPTLSPNNKKTKSLVDSMINDKKLTEAARIAQKEGKELNYFAKKDNNGRSVGIEEYNPSRQRIEAGFVVDNTTGKILGNHIKVDATGTQINVGGEVVNIGDIVGNPLDWKGDYEVSSTMERNIFKNAPNKETAQKTYKFVVANKIQAEATLRKEIESQRKTLNQNVKDVQKVKPRSVSDKDFKADIFDFIENKKSQADIASKYGPKATQAILKYKNETRKLYDNLLDRANTELAKFGEKTIPKRSDYITHINELNQQPSFAGELMGQLQNSMLGEGYTTTRGGVPGDIAGRTETFSPRKRWNPFAQQRKGGEYTKDPFKAVDAYLEPTLYNIHMTESAVRARAVESAFRTAEILKNTEANKVSSDLNSELEKYKKQSNNAKLVSGFQEYANALAGKTQRWDRQVIDASKGTATALKGWQGLQRVGGRATILGNVNSVLMQPLNQASVIAEVKLQNYIKGVAKSLAGNNVEQKSPFIRARAAKIESSFRGKGQKVMDAMGVPLQFVELASVKLAWNAEYQQVLSEGFKGQDAIIEADRRTEKAVAGRGIADKPEVYRSTLSNGLLQYTLEVNAQNKKFWRDLTPTQKGKFMVAAFGMNTVMEAVTGNEPLPDFIGAAVATFKDFMDDDDDTPLENAGKGVQRFAAETVQMNPLLSAASNLLPDDTKKTIFGSESELTRFEGVPAPIGVVQNAVKVGKGIATGDAKLARDSALKLVPGGNQIRKTLQGKELIQDGGKYSKTGKLQYEAPEGPLGKAQALLFGPSATKNAREYYDSMTDKLSGISTKKDSSGKEIDDFKTIAQASFGTEKGKEFMALTNDDQRKEFARASDENRGIYDQYKAMQKSFSGGDDLLPQGISQESEKVLNKYDRLVTGTKDKIFNREKGAEYEYNKARYERDVLKGDMSEADKIRRQKYLAKDKIGASYEKPIRDTYSLSKDQIKELVEGSKQGQKIYDQLVKYDQQLYDAGLIKYRKFKYGLGKKGRSGGRGRSSGRSESYALESQTLKNLRRILDGTTFKGKTQSTTPKARLAKQKKITVNTKA